MKKLIFKLFVKFFLKKHKFIETDVIKTKNGDVLFEVINCYYTKKLEPIIEVRILDSYEKGFLSDIESRDYVQYKGPTPGSRVY